MEGRTEKEDKDGPYHKWMKTKEGINQTETLFAGSVIERYECKVEEQEEGHKTSESQQNKRWQKPSWGNKGDKSLKVSVLRQKPRASSSSLIQPL